MTYEEAIKIKREWQKDAIRMRLHKYNPEKYPKPSVRMITSTDISLAWHVTTTIQIHEHGSLFERDNIFFRNISKGR